MKSIGAVFYRDYRQRITNIGFVFWDLFVPLAYLVLFGLGFERMLGGSLVVDGQVFSYTSFLLPGVLGMATFSVAMNTSWGFFMDKDSGIFYELLTYPITRQQLLIGKIGFNVLLSVIATVLAISLGVLALGVQIRWQLIPLTAAVVVTTTAGWFFLFSIFAIRLHRMDAFNTLTSAAYILLMFFSSMFYPLADVPVWFRSLAYLNPMTWQVDLMRFSLLGLGSPSVLVFEGAALVIFTMITLTLAVRALNRAN
ncbi:MAG TPA: ABC transporter permease [Pyrinomonadaceae bacterium]|nr:ABC transporter permease [Pyrinomonadaceae bacterium]